MRSRAYSAILLSFGLLTAACGDDDAPGAPIDAGAQTFDVFTGPDAQEACADPVPPPAMCDFFLSCGCDVPAGEKCTVDGAAGATGNRCIAAGVKLEGEECTVDTECTSGTICIDYGGAKHCLAYCDDAHLCAGQATTQACYINLSNGSGAMAARLCGQVCDLRGQDCGYPTQGCYPSSALGMPEQGICVTAGAGGEGAACTLANDCSEGFTCLNSDSKCHKLCDIGGAAPTCDVGTCQAIAGHVATGACR
jgi:hypothetical protein